MKKLPVFKNLFHRRPSLPSVRVLVTGSRGKSSMVRLLTAVLEDAGISPAGRITGVLPRELFRGGEKLILRAGPGSAGEMKWWLDSLPSGAGGVVLENSAVAPELQLLAWRWLEPSCTVLTNVRPDHEDAWGRGEEAAARVLCSGIGGGAVVLPESAAACRLVSGLLAEKGCELLPCPDGTDFRKTHLSLAEGVCSFLGFEKSRVSAAAGRLPPDIADFQIFTGDGGMLASAFSANDPESTLDLFTETGWSAEETTVLFNSRKDRTARLASFKGLMSAFPWKKTAVTGSRPLFLPPGTVFIPMRGPADLKAFVASEGAVLGCGNVAGVPLEYLLDKREETGGRRWG